MGHAVKQPKNDSHQNQDLTPPKSFLEGVQNPNFEYKNNNNYYYFIITIVLYFQLYQTIITRCSLYKNLDGMIIMFQQIKAGMLPLFSMELKCFLPKQVPRKNLPSPTLSRKKLTIIFLKKRQNT